MAELATLARPYASAAFDIAKADGDLARWSGMLALLGEAVADETIHQFLDAPTLPDSAKASRLADLFKDQLNDRARRFLGVLADNKRLPLLAEIAEQFEVLRAQEEQSLDVEVLSAFPLTAEQESTLAAALAKRFDKSIELNSRTDDSLLGGVIIRAGDTVIDNSISGRLNKLKETLQRN
ncbi:MAG: F0F1 ATP synthase subunit delta [Pseudomonadota bacterium]